MTQPSDQAKRDDSGSPGVGVLATRDYRPTGGNGSAFREAWGFKGDAIPRIVELLGAQPHPWIHACCGAAVVPGEDVRLDLFHPSGQPIDVQFIDQHYQNAGAIIIDPPYGEDAWGLDMRQRVVSACMRALGPGGLLIVHAPWQPKFTRRQATVERTLVREDSQLDWPMPPVLLRAYRKSTDPTLSGRNRRHQRERAKGKGGVR